MRPIEPNTTLLTRLAAITFLVALLGMQLGLTFHEAQHAACPDADPASRCVLCVAMAHFSALTGSAPAPVALVFCGILISFPPLAPACLDNLPCCVRGPPLPVQLLSV